MADGQFQTTNREVKTALPVDTTEMPIRKMDWKRIHRKIKGIPRRSSLYVTLTGVAFGVGSSALLSLIPLYQSAQLVESWVKPAYWIIGIASIIIGIITHHFAGQREITIKSSCEEVERDMGDIHRTFFPEESIDDQ